MKAFWIIALYLFDMHAALGITLGYVWIMNNYPTTSLMMIPWVALIMWVVCYAPWILYFKWRDK